MTRDAPPQLAIPPTKIPTSRSTKTTLEREATACRAVVVRNQVSSKQKNAILATGIGAKRQSVS